MNKYNLYTTEFSIALNNDNPVFGESCTKIRLQDEAGGLYLEIIQDGNSFNGETEQIVRIDFEEFKEIAKAVKILEQNAKRFQEIENISSFKYPENLAIISNKA